MKHVIFTQYLHSDENYNVMTAVYDNGYEADNLLVKTQKALLKKFGYQQKGWTVNVVDEQALIFLKLKFNDIKSVTWMEAAL
jgi:hypothetical protein